MSASKKLPSCYGVYWDSSATQCARCLAASTCENLTNTSKTSDPSPVEKSEVKEKAKPKASPVPPPEPDESREDDLTDDIEESVLEPTSPLEHFLASIEGKYSKEVQNGDKADSYKFRNNSGKLVIRVIVGASGRLKIESSKKSVVLDRIESIEKAEELLHEIL